MSINISPNVCLHFVGNEWDCLQKLFKSSFESRRKTTLFSVAYSLLVSPPIPPPQGSSLGCCVIAGLILLFGTDVTGWFELPSLISRLLELPSS